MKKQENRKYINRELSWLAFNQRVLDRAMMDEMPLLERVKFLAISAANLDEFMTVRMGGLEIVRQSGAEMTDICGMSATEQLNEIRARVDEMNKAQAKCLADELEPQLAQSSITRMQEKDLSENQIEYLRNLFQEELVSTIAPVAVAAGDEFPLLTGARLCLCVRIQNGGQLKPINDHLDGELPDPSGLPEPDDRFVLVPLGRSLARMLTIPADQGFQYILLEDVVRLFLGQLLENQNIVEVTPFRVIRNGDLVLEEDGLADLLSGMQEVLAARRYSQCVRLELETGCSDETLHFLQKAVGLDSDQVGSISGPLGLSDYFSLAGIHGFNDLKDDPWPAHPAPQFERGSDMFKTISSSDQLLFHPYQSYDPVIQFINNAADDPKVIAIKQTLYRASKNSKIVEALERAAGNGKHVTVIVELKARFDEARNIEWARRLEHAGADVIYGVRGLKTHAKLCIVVRREPVGIRRYVHFGTGNYNEATSRLYTDFSLFTCDDQLAMDAVHLFNAITGLSVPQTLVKLSAAPINLRERVMELIHVEIENAQQGAEAWITAKVNSLSDKQIIDALYKASQAGVKIRLNVRGICCLIPGKKGLSENIEVVSIVDRLLEHARVFHFHHGGEELAYLSSADWMSRNLNKRVELMVPVEEPQCKARVLESLRTCFSDNVSAFKLGSDGQYKQVTRKRKKGLKRSQEILYREAGELYAAHTNPRTTVFQPHVPGQEH
jgi:polyphosphate kinase